MHWRGGVVIERGDERTKRKREKDKGALIAAVQLRVMSPGISAAAGRATLERPSLANRQCVNNTGPRLKQ
ncbi:hypothetical protein EVAR_19021_1 [Eumeta japonica]|uniref:Uncharacterized protein n=1 Tax=Eumeta variegata TaxID=151549 RepID=A0A4C1V7V2_EUMVA|nr:hypothetical protein EVAR_19021_1 [Eumeta japonica]